MMGYRKTAKDLAFDKERTKLQKEISRLKAAVGGKNKTIRALTEELQYERGEGERKQEQIDQLKHFLDLDTNDIEVLIADARHRKELSDGLKWLQGFHGGIF